MSCYITVTWTAFYVFKIASLFIVVFYYSLSQVIWVVYCCFCQCGYCYRSMLYNLQPKRIIKLYILGPVLLPFISVLLPSILSYFLTTGEPTFHIQIHVFSMSSGKKKVVLSFSNDFPLFGRIWIWIVMMGSINLKVEILGFKVLTILHKTITFARKLVFVLYILL